MVKELFDDYDGTGVLLARTRKELGLSVADVAYHLRIREGYITAIESGRFSELPGKAYALGFMRNYAQFLGLDAEELMRLYRQESSWWRPRREFTAIEPVREENRPNRWVILASLAVLLGMYLYWQNAFYRPNDNAVPLRAPEEVLRPPPADPELVTRWLRQPDVTPRPREGACPAESLSGRRLADAIAHCKIPRGEYYTFLYQWLVANRPAAAETNPETAE